MKIGLVLAEPPGYSETFFRSKINGLTNHGFEVMLFVGAKAKGNNSFKVHKAWPVAKNNPISQLFFLLLAYTSLFFRAPGNAMRFYKLERKSGKSVRKSIESCYINAHILMQNLDWLHFGFTTLTIGKENVAKAIGAKMATSMRGFDVSIFPLKHVGAYDSLWDKLDKLHVISDDLYQVALSLGLPKEVPMVKITPAIDTDKFGVTNNVRIEDRWQQGHVKILTVARLHWKKGLDYALAVMKKLSQKGLVFTYNIVGEGPELERLRFETNQYGLNDHVNFLGKKTPEEIAALMTSHLIYLQPSIQEGFCNAVLEAQASGLLCIVSDAEGLSENVLDQKTGWVLPKRDLEGMANEIMQIVETSPSILNEVVSSAKQRIVEEFSVEDQVKQFIAFYEDKY